MEGITIIVGLAGPTRERARGELGSTEIGLPLDGEKLGLGRQVGEGPVTTESEGPNMAEEPNMATFESLANLPEERARDGARGSGENDRIGTTVPKVIDNEATIH